MALEGYLLDHFQAHIIVSFGVWTAAFQNLTRWWLRCYFVNSFKPADLPGVREGCQDGRDKFWPFNFYYLLECQVGSFFPVDDDIVVLVVAVVFAVVVVVVCPTSPQLN